MTARVLIVENSAGSGPRRLIPWLQGLCIETVLLRGDAGLPSRIDDEVHGIVLLGGGFMPDDVQRAPWLREERALAEQALEQDLPTLGICLGAQLIAQVGGGEVRANYGVQERGSTVITSTAAGRIDPVLSAIGEGAPMIENHRDQIVRLPGEAKLLASSEAVVNQAFLLGSHVRGVQFHPEASAGDLAKWDEGALRGAGFDLARVVAQAEANHVLNTAASRKLVEAFGRDALARAEVAA